MYAQLLERHKDQIETYQLYVRNLPFDIRQQQLVRFFNRYVQVRSVRIYNSKGKGQPCATVRFYDFQTMMKVYLKFGKTKFKKQQMYVEISRNVLLICSNCCKVGHWRNQCKQTDNIHRYQKSFTSKNKYRNNFDKSNEKISYPHKSQSNLESENNLRQSKCSFQKQKQQQKQEEEEESLQYFCPQLQLQQQQNSPINDKKFTQKQYFFNKNQLKQLEQDEITNYEDQQKEIFQQIQKQLVFVTIDNEKSSMNLLSPQENKKLQTLWNQGWFQNISDDIEPFVKIIKTSIHPLLN